MTVVEQLYSLSEVRYLYKSWKRDTITLPWEERCKSHSKRTSDGGLVFGSSLPAGTVLMEKNCFVLEPEQTVVQVIESPEPVYLLSPRTPHEWAYWAYQIGNRHQALMIEDEHLVCLQEPGVKILLEQLRIPFALAQHPFTQAVRVTGHSH